MCQSAVRACLAGVAFVALVAGCGDNAGSPDSGLPPDAEVSGDFAGMVQPDLPASPDLAQPDDMGAGTDGKPPADAAQSIDLGHASDLASADLAGPCFNGLKDGNESDVDCGGGVCAPCADGKICFKNADCQSAQCLNSHCAPMGMTQVKFAPGVSYAAGFLPWRVVLADFNGDGALDVATANQGMWQQLGDISVLLGTGNGVLQPAVKSTVGYNPSGIAAGDFNGDGLADLAVTSQGAGAMNPGETDVLLAGKGGVFGNRITFPPMALPNGVAIGDLNSDGWRDLVIVSTLGGNNGKGSGAVRLGDGKGGFGMPQIFTTGDAPGGVVLADVTRDGKVDAIVDNFGDQAGASFAGLHAGNGDGTFQPGATAQAGPGVSAIAVGDMNGDGNPDLVITDDVQNMPSISVLLNQGNGMFASHLRVLGGPDHQGVAVGDFNHDGKLDAAVVYSSGTVGVLRGLGDGTFVDEEDFNVLNNMSGVAIAAGDINKDGKIDLVLTDLFGAKIVVLLNATP